MRVSILIKRIALSLALLPAVANVQATPLIDFTSDNSGFTWFGNDSGCEGGCTLGYVFSLNSSITVDGMGVYDAGSNGLNNSHEVALWSAGGSLLASSSVGPGATASDPSASGSGNWLYSDINSLTLAAGRYVIGALYETGDTDHVVFGASGIFSNDTAASFAGSAWINAGTLQFPVNLTTATDRYFGPTLRIADGTVPLPGTLLLMGLGLAGLRLTRNRKAA